MVARTTPARRAISAMLASGSLASASRAAADLVAGRVEPREHAGLRLAGAGQDGDGDGDEGDAEPQPRDEHPGKHVAEVAAALSDTGKEQHPDGGDRERSRERPAHAVL